MEFAARLSQLMVSSDERIDLVVAVGGLANRTVEDDSNRYGVTVPSLSSLGGPGHSGTEQTAALRRKLQVDELTARHNSLGSSCIKKCFGPSE